MESVVGQTLENEGVLREVRCMATIDPTVGHSLYELRYYALYKIERFATSEEIKVAMQLFRDAHPDGDISEVLTYQEPDELTCSHPPDQRWQHKDMWTCSLCGRTFWGDKADTPTVDIHGVIS